MEWPWAGLQHTMLQIYDRISADSKQLTAEQKQRVETLQAEA